jgi:hypothetical protein
LIGNDNNSAVATRFDESFLRTPVLSSEFFFHTMEQHTQHTKRRLLRHTGNYALLVILGAFFIIHCADGKSLLVELEFPKPGNFTLLTKLVELRRKS